MQLTVRARQVDRSAWSEAGTLKEVGFLLAVLIAAAAFFGSLFDKETALSYSIGYNLYGAQRVLGGETPYRDFHTLYPPATVYLNAAIFKLLGISLYNALLGVFVFKVLTTAVLYLCGRMIMPRAWALLAAASSLLWLRPNGPFKAVPMHYGALFLAGTLLIVLTYLHNRSRATLIAAGISLGVLALFKHNIGAYALAGTMLVILPERGQGGIKPGNILRNHKEALVLAAGFLIPILPVVVYMATRSALGAMARTLLFGPGDFLLSRLAAWPSPLGFLAFAIVLGGMTLIVFRWRAGAKVKSLAWILVVLACCSFVILTGQGVIDSLIFYAPVGVILWGAVVAVAEFRRGEADWRISLAVLVIAASAFLEAFPRFAREQAVASMPFVTLLLLYLVRRSDRFIHRMTDNVEGPDRFRRVSAAALAGLLPLTLFLVGVRLFSNTYFDGGLRFRSDTELKAERGRGVFFPAARAAEIDDVVSYIRQRVDEGGFFFAHSYAGSSYLFLSDRKNPSGAQFWGGVGVTEAEKAATLKALEDLQVDLIVTTERDLKAETYQPMRQFIDSRYRVERELGDVLMLGRVEGPRKDAERREYR